MTSDEKLQHLQKLMAAFFAEARRRQKAWSRKPRLIDLRIDERIETTRSVSTSKVTPGSSICESTRGLKHCRRCHPVVPRMAHRSANRRED